MSKWTAIFLICLLFVIGGLALALILTGNQKMAGELLGITAGGGALALFLVALLLNM